jgi:hypothetical protein
MFNTSTHGPVSPHVALEAIGRYTQESRRQTEGAGGQERGLAAVQVLRVCLISDDQQLHFASAATVSCRTDKARGRHDDRA